jgi:regulator of protease activity HflC (stomatin/prohibitin superfamily)
MKSLLIFVGVLGALFVGFLFWFFPTYNVWSNQKSGEAALAHAESVRMILVTQAHAEREAAVQRAEAIKIVGQAAKDFPEYRHQEFIGAFAEALKEGKIAQIIYVPTEANIPIVEAGHRPQVK